MNTFAKLACSSAAALALALPFATSAVAGEKSDDIVVSSAAMKEWQAETTKDLNRALGRVSVPVSTRPNSAIVQVAFTLGADGKAENVELLDGQGNWAARRIAVNAVKRLNDLDTVPVRNPEDAQFLANIIFASTHERHKELAAKLWKSERARIAAAGGNDTTILLGG